jgi:hypothetical protein
VNGFSMCSFRNHLVTLTGGASGLLTEYEVSRPGSVIERRSFGDGRPLGRSDRDHDIIRALLASGKVICGRDGAWVAHVDRSFGEVRIYDRARTLQFHGKLAGFKGIDVRVAANSVINSVPASGNFDEVRSVVVVTENSFAIGIVRHERGADGRPEVRGYRMVEMDTKGRILREVIQGGLLVALDRQNAICFVIDPEPLVWRQKDGCFSEPLSNGRRRSGQKTITLSQQRRLQ